MNFNLVKVRTGTIRDSQLVNIGTMDSGQLEIFEKVIDR